MDCELIARKCDLCTRGAPQCRLGMIKFNSESDGTSLECAFNTLRGLLHMTTAARQPYYKMFVQFMPDQRKLQICADFYIKHVSAVRAKNGLRLVRDYKAMTL